MSDVISQLQQCAVGLGTSTYSTPSASFTRGLLVSQFTANPATQSVERVPEVSGSLRTGRVTKGPLGYDVTIGMPLDVGSASSGGIGDFLAALMGTDTATSGGVGVGTHVFTVAETSTPPYLNLYSTKDAVAKQIQGFRPSQIKFSVKSGDGMCAVEVTGKAQTESDLAAAQTLTFASVPLMVPSNVSAITVGGSAVTNFESVEITLKNEQEEFRPLSTSRTPANVYRKAWSANIALSGINFAAETQRTAYIGVTTSAFALTLTDSGTGSLAFAFPQVNITSFEGPNVADTDLMKINMGLMATGTLSAETITLRNAYTTNYGTGIAI